LKISFTLVQMDFFGKELRLNYINRWNLRAVNNCLKNNLTR